jgi:hypothetical protein
MKFGALGIVAVLGVVAQPALAELPLTGAALGQLEAVLEHCGRAKPAEAERYKALARSLTGNATEKELTAARQSTEYVEAHDAAKDQLAGLPKEAVDKACVEGLQPESR